MRAHKESKEAMKSEQREAAAEFHAADDMDQLGDKDYKLRRNIEGKKWYLFEPAQMHTTYNWWGKSLRRKNPKVKKTSQ